MEDSMIEKRVPYQPYYTGPFAVRDIHGRPFGCEETRTCCTDLSLGEGFETASVLREQRQQRQCHDAVRPRVGTETHSSKYGARDSETKYNFKPFHGHPQRPPLRWVDHTKMLKRSLPSYDGDDQSSKRPKMVGEAQPPNRPLTYPSMRMNSQDASTTALRYNTPSLLYNPLHTTLGLEDPLQANPLRRINGDMRGFPSGHLATLQQHYLEQPEITHAARLPDVVGPIKRKEPTRMFSATLSDQSPLGPAGSTSLENQVEHSDRTVIQPQCLPTSNTPSLGAEEAFADSTAAALSTTKPSETCTTSEPRQISVTNDATSDQMTTTDEVFIDQVKQVLEKSAKRKTANVFRRQARRISQLLEVARPADASEAVFLSANDTTELLESGNSFPGPIILEDQQQFPLQTVRQFLEEFYDDTAEVWIQDPSILLARNVPHAREITIGQLKQRFLQPTPKSQIPWNCLEMATPVDDGLRPAFLNNEDCLLLTKLKLPGSNDSASRRGYEPGWKEVEKWALLAQGGALTEPHQDSHGYSTYITVNQGLVGFGWLSNPTAEERLAWRDNPDTYTGGRWRYIILRPGQTVFFTCGTVHFVFRLASMGDTLAFGGHILRCSQIVRWVETMLEEKSGPDVTNEDLTVSAPAYLDRVEKFVQQARKTGQVERWGGEEAIEKFLRLKKEFMEAL